MYVYAHMLQNIYNFTIAKPYGKLDWRAWQMIRATPLFN